MVATAAPAAALLLLPCSPPLGFDRSSCYECYTAALRSSAAVAAPAAAQFDRSPAADGVDCSSCSRSAAAAAATPAAARLPVAPAAD
eukprot:707189-Alexandrium_andersonii.AAC.1